MTKEEALTVARRYVARHNAEILFHADDQKALGEPEEYRDFWYFGYIHVYYRGRRLQDWEFLLGGLPGFVVDKRDGTVHLLGIHALHALMRFEEAVTLLAGQPLTLALLRPHFRLPLLELQAFRRELEAPGLAPEQKIRRLQRQLLAEEEYEFLRYFYVC